MKKWLSVLGMITCMLALTACGAVKEAETSVLSEAEADELGRQIVEDVNQYVVMGAQAQAPNQLIVDAIASWESAAEDMGDYVEVISTESSINGEDGVIDVRVKGSAREAIVEIVIEKGAITAISTNVEYSFGEIIEKAALNTLLGMGTVFCVLILISFLISLFVFIPKLQEKFSKKPAAAAVTAKPEARPAVPQAVEEEDLTDDLEMVAVIAAAVAASEGAATTDGFVVRSIKRSKRMQRA